MRKLKIVRKFKKMSKYKKSLLIFTLSLLVLAEIFLIFINNTLKDYQKGDLDNYMADLTQEIAKDASKGKIDKYVDLPKLESDYEKKSSLSKGYEELFTDAKVAYKKTDEKNVYDILVDDQKVLTVKLKSLGTTRRLGLLVYDKWDIDDIIFYADEGLYSYDIYVADSYKLYINDTLASADDLIESSKISELSEGYDYVDLPKLSHYKINNLTYKPEIRVEDQNGEDVNLIPKDGALYATDFKTVDSLEEANLKDDYDPMELAKNWSLFLTADLEHLPQMGFGVFKPNLIEGSSMYQKAYNWATQVDIQFTSVHSFDGFTGEKLSNFTIYNENAFSVEVYLEKNMTILRGGPKTDVLHDIFYYVYYDGAYRLISMTSVTE